MATYTLTVDEAPKNQDVLTLAQGLTAHALPYTHVPGFQPLAVFLRDEQGILLGGVWGHVNWNWLSVGLVWLSDTLRGRVARGDHQRDATQIDIYHRRRARGMLV